MNGIITKRFQGNGCRQILHIQVGSIELARCLRGGKDIIRHLSPINQDRIDTQIQIGRFLQCIFGSQCIHYKLKIRNSFRSLFFQLNVEPYQLDTVDDYLTVQQRLPFKTGRKSMDIQHLITLQVVQLDIFHMNTVEQSQFDMSDRNLRIQEFS